MKTESQNQQLLKWLQSGKTIAPLQALNQLGIYRLASRCCDLRKEGHDIETKMIHLGNVKYAQYKLRK
jgi:hypothetical protein